MNRIKIKQIFYSLLFLEVVLLFFGMNWVNDYSADASYYIVCGENLLKFRQYIFDGVRHVKYPPGMSLWVAFSDYVFGKSYVPLAASMLVTALFSWIIVFKILKKQASEKIALFITALTFFSTFPFIFTATRFGSDIPFMAASFILILLSTKRDLKSSLLFSVVILLALSFRLPAVALVGACFSQFLFGKKEDRKFYFLPLVVSGLFLIAWYVWTKSVPPNIYDHMAFYDEQFWLANPYNVDGGNVSFWGMMLRPFVFGAAHFSYLSATYLQIPWVAPLWISPLVFIPAVFTILGIYQSKRSFLKDFVIIYGAILLVWPFAEDTRYIFPVLPFLALYCVLGAKYFFQCARTRILYLKIISLSMCIISLVFIMLEYVTGMQAVFSASFWIMTFLLLVFYKRNALLEFAMKPVAFTGIFSILLLIGVGKQVMLAKQHFVAGPTNVFHPATVKASIWIKDNTASEDIIFAEQHATSHRVSSRKTYRIPATGKVDILYNSLINLKADYLILETDKPYLYLLPDEVVRVKLLQEHHPGLLEEVKKWDDVKIFRVIRG